MAAKKKTTARRRTKKRTVKKAGRKATRRRNPSASARRKVAQAARLYEKFSGESPRYLDKIELERDTVLLKIGLCDGVLYTARRDGKADKYVHEFSGRSRPMLCSSADGKRLYLLGGKYDFTEDGIVDKK